MFRKILVPLDTSPFSEQAVHKAVAIARATHAAIHLVHVFEPPLPAFEGGASLDDVVSAAARNHVEQYMQRAVSDLKELTGFHAREAILAGPPVQAIIAYAMKEAIDLIVMTTHGRTGLSRAWFGNVADEVVRQATLPVLMVRPDEKATPKRHAVTEPAFERILVALDGSQAAETILDDVRALGMPSPAARLKLVRAVGPVPLPMVDYSGPGVASTMVLDVDATEQLVDAAKQYLDNVAGRLAGPWEAPVEAQVLVAERTAPAIVESARTWGADLVAMTSHGRGASRLIVGSVADKILRGTHCAVLIRRTAPVKVEVSERAPVRDLELVPDLSI